MNSHPPIQTTQHPLRFGDLSAADFERLCLGLLQLESDEWQHVEHYGQAGGDQGRDLLASRNGARWVVQCKRTQTFQPNQITPEVDKCNALNAALRPVGILFITSANVTAATRDEVSAYCQTRGFACEIWGRTDLDARVNRHPSLVAQFFGAASVALNPFLHQVAAPVADFTGRVQELAELTAHLQPRAQASACVLIAGAHGAGGIGKSELARKLVAQLRDVYPDAQLFLDLKGVAEQPLAPAVALERFIRALDPAYQQVQLPERVSELRGIYLSLLTQRRAIVVCDNARDAKQVEPLIPPAGCALIVTSRLAFQLPGMEPRHLDKLSADDACALLQKIARHLTRAEAERLAQLCGNFPQALRVYGNFLADRPAYPPEKYARRVAEAQARGELEAENLAAFETSYLDLLDAAQQRHWRRLAVFVSDFDPADAAAVMALDETDDPDLLLNELARLSMIEFDKARGRYWLHDLAQVYGKRLLTEAGERYAAELRYAAHYCDLLGAMTLLYLQGDQIKALQIFDTERGHILMGFVWAKTRLANDQTAAKLCMNYPDAGAQMFELRMHSDERLIWFQTQHVAAQQLCNRQMEAHAFGNLGLAYIALGEIQQAINCHEKDLEICRELEHRHGESGALNNLGLAYMDLGEMQQAIRYFKQSLRINRKVGDRRGEGSALGNLGLAYVNLNNARQSIKYCNQSLAINREIGNRRGEGIDLSNLGKAYVAMDKLPEAIAYFIEHLAITRELGDRFGEAYALGNLGWAYGFFDLVEDSIDYYEQALAIRCEIGDRMGEAIASWNLAHRLYAQGKKARAYALAQSALELFETTGSPHAAKVRDALAEWEVAA